MSFLDYLKEFLPSDNKGSDQPLRDSSNVNPPPDRATDKKSDIKDGALTVPPINKDIDLPAGWQGSVPSNLVADIPPSLLAMAPKNLTYQQIENLQQVKDLQGNPSKNPVAQLIERYALFDGAVRMPTSNDSHGHPLGREGCAKTPIEKVVAPVAEKYPFIKLPNMHSTTVENARVFDKWLVDHPGTADIYDLKMSQVMGSELKPGDMVIVHKGSDVHTLIVTRVPKSWDWPPDALMFTANTGLNRDSRGDNLGSPAMILAQEYIRNGMPTPETKYNNHGPINGPGTFREQNPYYTPHTDPVFTIIRFRNPDGTPSADGIPYYGAQVSSKK